MRGYTNYYKYFWHGSDQPVEAFEDRGPGAGVHLGSLEQAAMRCGGKHLHLIRVLSSGADKIMRCKDKAGDWTNTIKRARKRGYSMIEYLNRYEGLSTEAVVAAFDEGVDLDSLTDGEFSKRVPEAQYSWIVLDPSKLEIVARFEGKMQAEAGYDRMRELGELPSGPKGRPAEMRSFLAWIGRRSMDQVKIVEEKDFTDVELGMIEHVQSDLLEFHAGVRGNSINYKVACEKDGFRYLVTPHSLLVEEIGTGALAGGVSIGTIYVEPEFRKRGIAVELHKVDDRLPGKKRLSAGYFSRNGFRTRQAAHRELCNEAFEAGRPVAPENIEAYGLGAPVAERDDFEPA